MVVGEGCTSGGDGVGDAGLVGGDGIGVTLDDHRMLVCCDRRLAEVESVQQR